MELSRSQKTLYDTIKVTGNQAGTVCGSALMKGNYSVLEVKNAVNELFRLNDALRLSITEENGTVTQVVNEFEPRELETLVFNSKARLDAYGKEQAAQPILPGEALCEIKIVSLPNEIGIFCKMHHLICDAWSVALAGSQLTVLLNGGTPETYSYTQYLESEKKYRQSTRFERDKKYFEQQFNTCREPVFLSEKAVSENTSARKTFVFTPEQTKTLKEYAQKNNTTVFAVLTLAFCVAFSRYKMNAPRFYIGTAVLNRGTAQQKNTMGTFVNTVPVLIELKNASFSENLSEIQDTLFSAIKHQKYTYGDILEDLSREYQYKNKLYDVLFSYQNAQIEGGRLKTEWYPNGAQTESLQLHAEDRDLEGCIRFHYDYQTQKFTADEIERLHDHISRLLFSALDNDQTGIFALDWLSPKERQTLLFDFNDTAVEYEKNRGIHQLFEQQAKSTPDKTALIACDKTLTYRELNSAANRLANSLLKAGIGAGDIVAFCLPRKSCLIITMLGILKSGAAYLPIDPDHPRERIDYILSDSRAKLLITRENLAALTDNNDSNDPEMSFNGSEPCYCIYTSGSTGKPKGVIIRHKNVLNFVHDNKYNSVVRCIAEKKCKTIVSGTTAGFDMFVTESLLPLSSGLTVILANEDQSKLQNSLNELLKRHPADILQTTPTKMKMLLADKTKLDYMKDLKVIVMGGEVLEPALARELIDLSTAAVFNEYGPTETTVWSTNLLITDDVTIGKPVANTRLYITDSHMNIVPIGVTGELLIAGDGVGVGYLNKPELTAERFTDDPFGEDKLYKTGDLAYWREDGNVVFVGRRDFQVKLRGLRVEIGEIETALTELNGVTAAAVIVKREPEDTLLAYYTGKKYSESELRESLKKKLPLYMVPSRFMFLEAMPVNANGKTDKGALASIEIPVSQEEQKQGALPQTPEEDHICRLFSEVLKVKTVFRETDFFDLGGTSLDMIKILSDSAFEKVSAADFMAAPTPMELAKRISAPYEIKWLKPLYLPERYQRLLVLFPFAGGNASAYTAFTRVFEKNGSDIALYYIDWVNNEEQYQTIAEELFTLAKRYEISFYSHCAGSVIALKLLELVNRERETVKYYIAGASLPPANKLLSGSIWKHMKDAGILWFLKKGGLRTDGLDALAVQGILDRFRCNTNEFTAYFAQKKTKTKVKAYAILSKYDVFTVNYRQADRLWSAAVSDFEGTALIDSRSHYFQSENVERLVSMIESILLNG